MPENLEGKWRVGDLGAIRRRVEALGASFQWERWQRDVYFAVTKGRLKLRIVRGGPAELIAYFRPDHTGMRLSRYTVARIPDWETVLDALSSTVGQLAQVEKLRTLFLWRNVRVHLDEVLGLGTFVELESVVQREWPRDVAEANFRELVLDLQLEEGDAVARSYLDLLLETKPEDVTS